MNRNLRRDKQSNTHTDGDGEERERESCVEREKGKKDAWGGVMKKGSETGDVDDRFGTGLSNVCK